MHWNERPSSKNGTKIVLFEVRSFGASGYGAQQRDDPVLNGTRTVTLRYTGTYLGFTTNSYPGRGIKRTWPRRGRSGSREFGNDIVSGTNAGPLRRGIRSGNVLNDANCVRKYCTRTQKWLPVVGGGEGKYGPRKRFCPCWQQMVAVWFFCTGVISYGNYSVRSRSSWALEP